MARVSARVIFVCRVVLGETLSVDWRERGTFGKNPFRHFALRNASSPFCRLAATSSPGWGKSFHSGGGLGKEGRSRPHSSTAGRSQPISGKLSAFAKASPFRERWHGEAVTERVDFREEPSQSPTATAVPLFVAYRRHLPPAGGSLSKGEPLAEPVGLVLIRQRQNKLTCKA